jgi:hypothetical protein
VTQLATIGHDQIRPRDMEYVRGDGLLAIGTQPQYGKLGGALALSALDTGSLDVYRDVVQDQSIASVASVHGVVYLGSEIYGGTGSTPVAKEGHLAAFDLATRRKLWEIAPVPGAPGIDHLAVVGDRIYGTTSRGTLFVVDRRTHAVLATERAGAGEVDLAVKNHVVYGINRQELFWIDPETFAKHVVADGLGADPFAFPQLATDRSATIVHTCLAVAGVAPAASAVQRQQGRRPCAHAGDGGGPGRRPHPRDVRAPAPSTRLGSAGCWMTRPTRRRPARR